MSAETAVQTIDGGVPSGRDKDAISAFIASGGIQIPTSKTTSEYSPERAVILTLVRLLARVEGHIENLSGGPDSTIRFAVVRNSWPDSKDAARYPTCLVQGMLVRKLDALIVTPVRRATPDPIDKTVHDVVTDDFALWRMGEDVGEGMIVLVGTTQPQIQGLAEAVQQLLLSDLDPRQNVAIPLPEAFLPPPFQGVLPREEMPVAELMYLDSQGPFREDDSARAGTWRIDIRFRWRAPCLIARARIPDLRVAVPVTVGVGAVEHQEALR